MHMKYILSRLGLAFGVFALSVSFALPAAAMTARGGDTFVLPAGEAISDDLYVGGGTVIINGIVNGDVYVGTGTLIVNGQISQDLVAGGGNITISGIIGDDLRIAGGSISILGEIKGDVIAGGGNVIVSKDAVFGQDLIVGAGSLVMEGRVKRAAILTGGTIVMNGRIDGPLEIHADEVRFGGDARTTFKARVFSPREAIMDEGSQLADGVDFTKTDKPASREGKDLGKPLVGFLSMVFILELIGLMIASAVLVSIFKTYSNKLVDRSLDKPGRSLLYGFATLFLIPIAVVILMISILGSWLGGLLAIGYVFLVAITKLFGGVVFGAWLWRLGTKGKSRRVDWKIAVMGTFLVGFLALIPFLGWIVLGLVFLATLGGTYMLAEERLKAMR
jgi:hypothetical protein